MAHPTIQIPFSNEIMCHSVLTKAEQTKSGISVYLEPHIQETYVSQKD